MKNKRLAGYRLHLKRLEFSDHAVVRTIKYPLGMYDVSSKTVVMGELEKDLASRVKREYESLYGPLNLMTYINNLNNPDLCYSLKDFWIDCLRAGAVMLPSTNKLQDFLNKITKQKNIDDDVKNSMKKQNSSFYDLIAFEKFKNEILLSGPMRDKKSFGFWKHKKDDTRYKVCLKFQNQILKDIKNHKSSDKEYEYNYWIDNFGADKGRYKAKGKTTFYIMPDIPLAKDMEPVDLIARLEKYLKENLGDSFKVENYSGIASSGSGLAQLFGEVLNHLVNGNTQSVKKLLDQFDVGVWTNQEAELEKRLDFLSGKLQSLNKSALFDDYKSYKEYRSDFAGKVQSWLGNISGQDNKIKDCLFPNDNGNDKAKGHLYGLERIENKLDLEQADEIDEIKEIVSRMKKSLSDLEEFQEDKIPADALKDYVNQLKDLRIKLNYSCQEVFGEGDNKWEKEYKSLVKPLRVPPKIPSFLGDVKTRQGGVYEKYIFSLDRVRLGVEFLESIKLGRDKYIEVPASEEDRNKRIKGIKNYFQGLLRIYLRDDGKIRSEPAKQMIEQSLKEILDVDLRELKFRKDDFIYRARHSRRLGKKLDVKEEYIRNDSQKLIDGVPEFLKLTKIRWSQYSSSAHLNDWVYLIEIEKIRFGLLSQNYHISELKSQVDALRDKFENIELIFNRYLPSDRDSNKTLESVINQAILSEIKGTISKMTTEEIVARYVIQPIKSNEKFPIVTEIKEVSQRREKTESYYINFSHPDLDLVGSPDNFNVLGGKFQKAISPGKRTLKKKSFYKSTLARLNSSNYQIQFLDNSFSGKWPNTSISEYSFVYEELYKLNWRDNKFEITKKLDSDKLFVSIPFNIHKQSKEEVDFENKYLGVDLGEYGVATYILDIDNLGNDKPETSFIYEESLRKIRYGIKRNKSRQKSGTFSIPNTYIKRLRNVAYKSVRNRIHTILVESKSKPVYEWNVSAFESGSGAISKVYHSIKKSDTSGKTDADRAERKLIWGNTKQIGLDVAAYGTSYMCNNCHKSIYQFVDYDKNKKDKFKYRLCPEICKSTNKENCKIEIEIDKDIRVFGYIKKNKLKENGLLLNNNDTIRCVREYSRPPLSSLLERNDGLRNVFKRFARSFKFHGSRIRSFEEYFEVFKECFSNYAGSQAIYECPFCGAISDADLQAAMWIALRGYLKDCKEIGKKLDSFYKKDKKKYFGYISDFAKNNNIRPIGLDLSKRLKPNQINNFLKKKRIQNIIALTYKLLDRAKLGQGSEFMLNYNHGDIKLLRRLVRLSGFKVEKVDHKRRGTHIGGTGYKLVKL